MERGRGRIKARKSAQEVSGPEPLESLFVRIPRNVMRRLDAATSAERAKLVHYRITKADLVRRLLTEGLDRLEGENSKG
jgi:hypothetical protein